MAAVSAKYLFFADVVRGIIETEMFLFYKFHNVTLRE